MALNIENTSGSPLAINDLGIELSVGQIVDLSLVENPFIIANSANGGDLDALITAPSISVKDPIDGITALSVADGLEAVRTMNETHWRMPTGSRIGDISDVDISSASPGDVLRLGSSGGWENTDPTTIGSALVLEEEGVTVGGGPHSILNFVGASVTVTDAGGGEATITVTASTQNIYETFAGDSGTPTTASSPTDTLTITGGTNVSTIASPDTITVNGVNIWNTVAGDSGSTNPDTALDTLTVAGGTGISTAVSGDTLTITNDSPNVDQNLFETVSSDSGSTTADTTTDTLTISGGTGISTAIVGDVLTITNDDPNVNQNLFDTIVTPAGGPVVADSATDTLTLTQSAGISITGTAGTDTINIAPANDLAALEALATTGFPARTGAETWALRSLIQPAAGLTITNPAGIAGNPTFSLANDLAALEALGSTGVAVRTGANTWVQRTVVASAAEDFTGINVVNGDGVSGNPTIGLDIDGLTSSPTEMAATDEFAVHDKSEGTGGANRSMTGTQIANGVSTILGLNADSDLAGVTVANSATTAIPLTWTDVTWDTTHFENDPSIIEHNNSLTDRIEIKETGTYFVFFNISFDADSGEETIEARVRVNDTTVLPGSIRLASEDDETNDLSNAFMASLTSGDFLTFQTQASGSGNTQQSSSNFSVVRARGARGAQGPSGAGSTVVVQEEGATVTGGPHSTLNFIGSSITATDSGGGVADITVTASSEKTNFHYNACELDSPVNDDWAVNGLAPASPDTVNAAVIVRRFDDTTEEGVGWIHRIPTGVTNMTINFVSRRQTAGSTQTVIPRLYRRQFPDNAAPTAWSSQLSLTALSFPNNVNYQYDSQTITLATLGLTAGQTTQFELTRLGTVSGDTLSGDWNLLELRIVYT